MRSRYLFVPKDLLRLHVSKKMWKRDKMDIKQYTNKQYFTFGLKDNEDVQQLTWILTCIKITESGGYFVLDWVTLDTSILP